MIVGAAGTGLLVARAVLPTVLTWMANLGVRRIPGYHGKVQKVGIDFTAPSLAVHGLVLAKFNGSKPVQLLELGSLIVGSEWRSF